MISKEIIDKIDELMLKRGYTHWAETKDAETGELRDIMYMHEFKFGESRLYPIVTVYPKELGSHHFKFHSLVNPGALEITSGELSPLESDHQFNTNERCIIDAIIALSEGGFN